MYKAIIAPLTQVRRHGNADRLQLATVVGNQVVIGLEHQEGELGVYFPPDGQLSHEMTLNNGLYSKQALEQLGLPVIEGDTYGFFDIKRRVRAQKFRSEKSDGLWLPLESLEWFSSSEGSLIEGMLIDNPQICQRYETPRTRISGQGNKQKRVKRGETFMFPKHYDTEQFAYYWQDIPIGSIVYVTEKLHGTSGRYGYVQDDILGSGQIAQGFRYISGLLGRMVGVDFIGLSRRWIYLNGSRNVILEHTAGAGYYGTNDFREEAVKNITLRKGEVIFFEIVGDVSPGISIMHDVVVPKKELPEIYKHYGDTMHYRYGCKSGEHRLYVYRIIMLNEDGYGVDLSWPQVKRRCRELGLNCVPDLKTYHLQTSVEHQQMYFEIEQAVSGPSTVDSSHIREGVAVRVESPDGRIYCLKHKSFAFKLLEGIVKDHDVVDMEEVA